MKTLRIVLTCLMVVGLPSVSQAGCKLFGRRAHATHMTPCVQYQQVAPSLQYAQPQYASPQYAQQTLTRAETQTVIATYTTAIQTLPQTSGGDPYGFTNWLNSTRAQYGLPPVGYDPNLEGWAAQNNAQQNARGMGHHVMGPARRQNSAMGSYGSIPGMWLSSPAHRSALLDPSIRFIGLAGAGMYWTFNAY